MNEFVAPHVDWAQLSPVAIVLLAAVVGVLVEAFVPAARRRVVQLALAFAALAGAILAVALLWNDTLATGGTEVLGGALLVDGTTLVLQGTIAVLALLSVMVIADRTVTGEDAFAPQAAAVPGSDYEDVARTRGLQQTEVFPLVLFATGGMLIFPATGDLLTLFVALEVLSLPLYLLSGMGRRRRLLSQEASMKYFLLGAFASAFMLFGIALLYGYSGSLRYADIAEATHVPGGLDGLLLAGAVLLLAGLLFKIGAVPFHSWTPDVYQGAPTPITGFMAACTKVAAFGALLRVVYVMLPDLQWDLGVVLWAVAIASMVVGTAAALVQTDMKRVLAYSAVAHTGFVLTGIIALNEAGLTAVLFYLLAYGAATVGAFGIVSLVRERSVMRVGAGAAGATRLAGTAGVAAETGASGAAGTVGAASLVGAAGREAGSGDDDPGVATDAVLGEATHLSQWAGLGRTNPLLAGTFALFLLSFAGIPLTAGFTGKFAVFSAAVDGGATALAVVGVLASAVAAFFYVRIIVLMFFTPPAGDADGGEGTSTTVVGTEGFAVVAIGICAVVTVLLGVVPSPVLELIGQASMLLP